MSDTQLNELDAEERRDKIRSRVLLAIAAIISLAVALWVGGRFDTEQHDTRKAQKQTQQAQVEKYNLAQQIAAACADPKVKVLDDATYARLCTDARSIVREGPRGAQGIPGPQGIQGLPGYPGIQGVQGIPGTDGNDGKPGANGKDGADGKTGAAGPPGKDGLPGKDGAPGPAGPAGPPGADGKDGAVGPMGPPGADGANGLTPTQMTCTRNDPVAGDWDCQVTAWK